ncbi:MAG: DUF6273 domain-containing protein [Oscillospiraceae bacterium]|nr:DUF6273 domain-containing protein [Oscillospiraceae bacterium]
MKQTRKITAAIMAAAMILQAAPLAGSGLTAHAEGEWRKFTKGNTTLGTSVISAPKAPETVIDAWTGSYVYYGQYKNQPVKYRVLNPNETKFGGTTMLLDCDTTLFRDAFRDEWQADDANVWTASDLYKVLNTGDDAFLNKSFTSAEAAAIAASTRETHELVEGNEAGNVADWTKDCFVNYTPLTGEKIFLLDAEDASNTAYGYSFTDEIAENRIKKTFTAPDSNAYRWWLRSLSRYTIGYAGSVYGGDGTVDCCSVDDADVGVSPAFNVDLSSVILSSKVTDVDGDYGDEYKLTLKDPNTTITPGTLTCKSGTVTVPYTVTDSDAEDGITADTVSVLITNANGAVRYYAPLKGDFSANGSGTFDLSADIDETDKIYILAEDVNGQYETDYASELVELDLTPELADGKYMQTAEKDGTYYTRFVFVEPKSEIKGKSKAIFTATYNGKDYRFETNTYYTGVTTNGMTYTPGSKNSVLFVVTVSSGSDISNDLTCKLDFE